MVKRKTALNNKKGAAMLLVLCIMMIFLTLSLSLLLAASMVQGSARKAAVRQQLKVAVLSYSELLTDQLVVGEEKVSSTAANSVKGLFRDLVMAQGAAGLFDSKNSDRSPIMTKLSCSMDGQGMNTYLKGTDIRLEVYWEGSQEQVKSSLQIAGTREDEIAKAYDGIMLYVDVIGQKSRESYRLRSEYGVAVKNFGSETQWTFTLGGRYES